MALQKYSGDLAKDNSSPIPGLTGPQKRSRADLGKEGRLRPERAGYLSGQWVFIFSPTPLGSLCLYFTSVGLAGVEFDCPPPLPAFEPFPASIAPAVERTGQELARYFAGIPTDFRSLTLDLRGTQFQLRVWQELRRIPWGAAISYRELARRVGSPNAFRAVGQANAVNPIPLIIPCHRVIAADGSLGGYSSGLDRKRWLLEHEAAR